MESTIASPMQICYMAMAISSYDFRECGSDFRKNGNKKSEVLPSLLDVG